MPTLPTGRLPTPPDVLARYRVSLANAAGLANYQASLSTVLRAGQGLAPPTQVINSSSYDGSGSLRAFGNLNFENCITAAIAYHKLLVTSSTGATALYLPEGGNPSTSDTQWGTGLASNVPANSPGVIAWSQANGCLNYSYIPTVLGLMATPGTWPNGGMVHSDGTHHLIGSFGAIDWTNQAEVTLAISYFKTVLIGMGGNSLLSVFQSSRFLTGAALSKTDNHCWCICDCGPASVLAAKYGVSVPGGVSGSTFCVGGPTWGVFCIVDWASLQNLASEAWVIITDPDRGDASTFTPIAQADYRSLIGTNGPFLAAACCSYQK